MSQPTVVVIGDALIDELRTPAGTVEHVGGAALNVAVGLRRLGIDTALIAMVGTDPAGERIRIHLADRGVALIQTTTDFSSRAVSDRVDGEPRYVFNAAARGRHLTFDSAQCAAVAAADVVVVSCFPFDDADQFARLERALDGTRIIVDPNPRTGMMHDARAFAENFERLAAGSALVKVGEEDAEILGRTSLAAFVDRLIAGGDPAVLATAGSAGATLHLPGGVRVHVPVSEPAGAIVDTMGAGDATLASAVASIVEGGMPTSAETARRLLRRAMDIAAATCRAHGAELQLPG